MKYNNSPTASTSHPPGVAKTFCWELFYGSVCLSQLGSALQPPFFSHLFFFTTVFYEAGHYCALCTHDNVSSPCRLSLPTLEHLKPTQVCSGIPTPPKDLRGSRLRNFSFARRRAYFKSFFFKVLPPKRPPLSPHIEAFSGSRNVHSCKKRRKKNRGWGDPASPRASCATKWKRITISSFARACFFATNISVLPTHL